MAEHSMDINIKMPKGESPDISTIINAIKQNPGATSGISTQYQSMQEATAAMKDTAEQLKKSGMQMGNVRLQGDDQGGVTASADVTKKAYSPGGMIAGMATAVGAIGAGFKTLLDMSTVFKTFMGTTMKILGTAIDLMLAPLMPIFLKIMVWIMEKIFPLATKVGDWLGGLGTGTVVAGAVAGYVGLKVAPTVITSLGAKIGEGLANKLPGDTIGESIAIGLGKTKDKLLTWADDVGTEISRGLKSTQEILSGWYSSVAKGIQDAFSSVTSTISEWYSAVAKGVQDAFSTVTSTISTWYSAVAKGVQDAFSTVTSTISTWYTSVAGGIQDAFSSATSTISTWYSSVAKGIQDAFSSATSTISEWYTSVAGGIQDAFSTATSTISDWYTSVATGISSAFNSVTSTLSTWYTSVATGISGAFNTVTSTLDDWYKSVATGVSSAFNGVASTLDDWYKSVATGVQGAFDAASSTLTSWYKAVAEGLGKAMSTVTGWATSAGKVIGEKVSSVVGKASGSWKAIGGMVGLGIGAAALGAAIGYSMWKAYKDHEAGKDITKDTDIETYRMLRGQYGMEAGMSKDIVAAWRDPETSGISRTQAGFDRFTKNYTDIMDITREFGTGLDQRDSLMTLMKNLEQSEWNLIANRLTTDMMEEKPGALEMGELVDLLAYGYTIADKAGFAKQQVITAGAIGGGEVDWAQKQSDALTEGSVVNRAAYSMALSSNPMMFAQMGDMQERNLRETVENLFGGNLTGKDNSFSAWMGQLGGAPREWATELDPAQAAIGIMYMSLQGKNIGDFIPSELLEKTEGLQWSETELARYAREGFGIEGFQEKMSAINISINQDTGAISLSEDDKKFLLNAIAQTLEQSGATLP